MALFELSKELANLVSKILLRNSSICLFDIDTFVTYFDFEDGLRLFKVEKKMYFMLSAAWGVRDEAVNVSDWSLMET